jgi:protein-disulfide isomerase
MSMTINSNDHTRGDENAKITLIEYADFECPYCARAHQSLTALLPKYGKDVRLVYRHMPLNDMHPDAQTAAEAAEAAGADGKFWEMHDALFEGQDDLSDAGIVAMAAQIGFDQDKLQDAIENGTYAERVASDAATGRQAGAHRTPTFFINGVQFDGDSDEASLDRAISAVLKG